MRKRKFLKKFHECSYFLFIHDNDNVYEYNNVYDNVNINVIV